MRPSISINDDYAVFSSNNLVAYYGYEEVDKDGNWCFKAEFGGETIVIPSSKLKLRDGFNATEGLLMGIAILTTKYKLALK